MRSVRLAASCPRAGATRLAAPRAALAASTGTPIPATSSPAASTAPAGARISRQATTEPAPTSGSGERRGDTADEQVLGRVDVGDQPGEQVTRGERGQPGRGEPLQPPVDPDPDAGKDPECGVV